jgi:hypothetical protein
MLSSPVAPLVIYIGRPAADYLEMTLAVYERCKFLVLDATSQPTVLYDIPALRTILTEI